MSRDISARLPFAVLLMVATVPASLGGAVRRRGRQIRRMTSFPIRKKPSTRWRPPAIRSPISIISALQDGRLMADPDTKKIYVTQPDGKIIDAADRRAGRQHSRQRRCGAPQQPSAPPRRGRARQPDAAVARPRQARRRPRNRCSRPMTRPCCRRSTPRWQKETNKDAKLAFTEARAAILLFKEDATEARETRSHRHHSRRAATRKRWRC